MGVYNNNLVWPVTDIQRCILTKVLQNIDKNIYTFNKNECLCGDIEAESVIVAKHDRFGIDVDVAVCTNCGLIRNTFVFTEETISSFYKDDYHSLVFCSSEQKLDYFIEQNERGYRFYKLFQEKVDRVIDLDIIEIGSGCGGVLYPFARRNNRCVGYEYSQSYAQYGISRGLDIRPTEDLGVMEDGCADIVILSHVLENCIEPRTMLAEARRLLRDEGHIIIEVPGLFNFPNEYPSFSHYLVIAHFFHFTAATLSALIEDSGFSVTYSDETATIIAKKNYVSQPIWHNPELVQNILNFLSIRQDKEFCVKSGNKFLVTKEKIKAVFRMIPGARIVYQMVKKFFLPRSDDDICRKVFVLDAFDITDEEFAEVHARVKFYATSDSEIIRLGDGVDGENLPVLVFGKRSRRQPQFFIDWRSNPMDGWEWVALTNYAYRHTADISAAHARFKSGCASLPRLEKAYVFGTGPSLEKATERVWEDGYRIVCNTVVRDKSLWHHINPHIIVAGDAIYHFGCDAFACAFREDLQQRLSETRTLFLYPSLFDGIVSRMNGINREQCVPVPTDVAKTLHHGMIRNFYFPGLGNVLPMLLAVACTLAKDISLWGFDGKAPGDALFWKNSTKQHYPEFVPALRKAHPAFFDFFVPEDNPMKYIEAVHGDELKQSLNAAQECGWNFRMLHKSWTPLLAELYCGNSNE